MSFSFTLLAMTATANHAQGRTAPRVTLAAPPPFPRHAASAPAPRVAELGVVDMASLAHPETKTMKTTSVLIVEYTQSRTRAWNFLQHALQGLDIHCLVDSGRVQVLLVQSDSYSMDSVLQYVCDDLRSDLRQAYWFGCPHPESRTHVNGNSAGDLISPYSNPETLGPRGQAEP